MSKALTRSERGRVDRAQREIATAPLQSDPANLLVSRSAFQNWARLLINARVSQPSPGHPATTKVRQ